MRNGTSGTDVVTSDHSDLPVPTTPTTQKNVPLISWLTNKLSEYAQKEAPKVIRKKFPHESLYEFAHWVYSVATDARNPKDDEIFQSIVETKKAWTTGRGTTDAAIKIATNLYNYPNDTMKALLDYGIADAQLVETVKNEPMTDWTFRKGLEWMGYTINDIALTSFPSMFGYYVLFGKLPWTKQKTVEDVRQVVAAVENKIVRRFRERGISIDEPSAWDLATKLVVLAYLHPMDVAQSVLDYATNDIVSQTLQHVESMPTTTSQEERIPGSWIGGGRRWIHTFKRRGASSRSRKRRTFKKYGRGTTR